ncbi:hypothetical protein EKO27_g2853 [Xylaria grammica]|uniref:Uncharacterized protein n=1 Tax=Xylaria grammica TaxID=363999 RepID=A0A439DCV4_9PEZI|nr:hypothetical protein EKO27_g2853 [Xylaria grammica]
MSQAYMHPQHESRLLSVPIEIRRAIYANAIPRQIHVFLSQGKLRLSACLEPNLGDHRHDGRERGRDHFVGSNVRDPEAEARLNITFRLPVAFYEELEYGIGSTLSRDHLADNLELTSHSKWAYVWSTIHRLQQLRSLYIWLDHDGRRSWSVVKERLALHHLIAGLTAQKQIRQAKELPPTEISVNLPKLHPGISGPLTHFVGDGPQLPFTIERRYRQRFHCRQDASGRLAVEYEADFPILYEISELQEANGDLTEDVITLEEIEDLEERMWERGENVNGVINELYGMCIHWGNM